MFSSKNNSFLSSVTIAFAEKSCNPTTSSFLIKSSMVCEKPMCWDVEILAIPIVMNDRITRVKALYKKGPALLLRVKYCNQEGCNQGRSDLQKGTGCFLVKGGNGLVAHPLD